MRARTAALRPTTEGSYPDRFVCALSTAWEGTGAIKARADLPGRAKVTDRMRELAYEGIIDARQLGNGILEWRRGPLWEQTYG